jgi:hypothetical protein
MSTPPVELREQPSAGGVRCEYNISKQTNICKEFSASKKEIVRLRGVMFE